MNGKESECGKCGFEKNIHKCTWVNGVDDCISVQGFIVFQEEDRDKP